MIIFVLAILTSVGIIVFFKLFERLKIDNLQAITLNYITAFALGLYFNDLNTTLADIYNSSWIKLAFTVGFSMIMTFNIFALSSQKIGLSITAVSSKMSVIIPVFIGFLFYNENLNFLKIIGILLALVSFYLTLKPSKTNKFDKKLLILPILLFLGNGMNDSIFKHADKFYLTNDKSLFISMSFLTSFTIGLIILIILFIKNKTTFSLRSFISGIILGIINFFATYFFILALSKFESSVFFPIFNVSIVSLATILGYIIFKERLQRINYIGLFLSLVSILLIAFS